MKWNIYNVAYSIYKFLKDDILVVTIDGFDLTVEEVLDRLLTPSLYMGIDEAKDGEWPRYEIRDRSDILGVMILGVIKEQEEGRISFEVTLSFEFSGDVHSEFLYLQSGFSYEFNMSGELVRTEAW